MKTSSLWLQSDEPHVPRQACSVLSDPSQLNSSARTLDDEAEDEAAAPPDFPDVCLEEPVHPSCLYTTRASDEPKLSSHTVVQEPPYSTSRRPAELLSPEGPISRIELRYCPLAHVASPSLAVREAPATGASIAAKTTRPC